MNEQRDNLTTKATNGRASPVGHERLRLPGCHQAQVWSRAFQHGTPTMTNGALADSRERPAKINLTSRMACGRMTAQSANNTRLEGAAMKQN